MSLANPKVAEVHEAARDLMTATGTNDLLAAYAVLDELAAEIKLTHM